MGGGRKATARHVVIELRSCRHICNFHAGAKIRKVTAEFEKVTTEVEKVTAEVEKIVDRLEVGGLITLVASGILILVAYVSVQTPVIVVTTGSMMPSLVPGDLVFIHRPDFAEISVGDIVAFRSPDESDGQITVHRVVEKRVEDDGTILFFTKGDATPNRDEGYLKPTDIYGRVFFHAPLVGRILLLLRSPSVLVVIGVSVFLYFWYGREGVRSGKKKRSRP